jgi:hypothetical protein
LILAGGGSINPSVPNAVCEIKLQIPTCKLLLSFAQLDDGARALARFNVLSHAAREMPSPLAFGTLKRRERRAPLTLAAGHHVLWFPKIAAFFYFRLCTSPWGLYFPAR